MSILTIKRDATKLDEMIELSNLSSSPFDGKKWFIEVVPCADATCNCLNASLLFKEEHQVNTSQYSFYIEGDLAAEKLNKLHFSTPEASLTDLSKPTMLLEELLTKEDWKQLLIVHRISKGVFIENCDWKEVEATFPIEQLKDPSAVVLYHDIFPLASHFNFDKNEEITYIVFDQYCSNHKCNCSDVVLSFTKDNRNEDFAFRYNYKTQQVEILEEFGYDITIEVANNYVRLLKEKFKEFNSRLEKRNLIMRHLFKKFTQRMNHEMVKTNRISGKKIGRNEACPCGSGKKYKKCCAKK